MTAGKLRSGVHPFSYPRGDTSISRYETADTMLIIRNSARGGWWDGAVSSLGICSGLFVHAAISALGISIILLHTAWGRLGDAVD